jgi:hypothetical protein
MLFLASAASAQTQFGQPATVSTPVAINGIMTGDVNRDGRPDVLGSTGVAGGIQVCIGQGDGTLGAPTGYPFDGFGSLGDLTSDGYPDFASAKNLSASINVAVNDGSGGFAAGTPIALSTGEFVVRVRLADMNLDGKLDLLVSTFTFFQSVLQIGQGNGGGGFSSLTLAAAFPSNTSLFNAVDINHDGALDIGSLSSNGGMATYLNNGSGGLGPNSGTFYGIGFFASGLDFADVNQDGYADAAIASHSPSLPTGNAAVALGNGTGQFPIVGQATSLSFVPNAVAFRDVSGDGVPDLVLSEASTTSIAVLTSTTQGVLTPPVEFPSVAGSTGGFAVNDLDGDGRLDVVLGSSSGSGLVATLRNLTPYHAGVTPFGTGTAGCDGIHGLTTNSAPAVGNLAYGYLATQTPRNSLGLVLSTDAADFAGSDPFFLFIALHVNLFAATQVYAFDLYTDPFGGGFAPVPIPNNPILQGQTFYTQAIFAWTNPCSPTTFGLSSSRALVKTIQ